MRRVFLTGNLGKDAELKTSKNDKTYLTFSVASTERRFDGSRETEWVFCSMYGGEKLQPYLTKGTKVAIMGKPREVNGDNDKPVLYLTVTELELLGSAEPKEHKKEPSEKKPNSGKRKSEKITFDDDENEDMF